MIKLKNPFEGWSDRYTRARGITKYATYLMYLSAVVLLLNAYCGEVRAWSYWYFVMRLNAIILLAINGGLLYVGYLNFAERSNILAWTIDDAYGTSLAKRPCPENYYDNPNIQLGHQRFVLDIFESCFFSHSILKRMHTQILIRNLFILIPVVAAFTINKNGWIVSVLQCFLSFYLVRKLIMFWIVAMELDKILEKFRLILSNYRQSADNDVNMQAAFQTICDYETSMVWLNAALSDEIYKNINGQLTVEWKEMQKGLVKEKDFIQ